jgi:hypothetical protein
MSEQEEEVGAIAYVVAGLSYIPVIGILFGLVAVIWGLVTNKSGGRKLALIGGGGIVFTVVLYSALFHYGFSQRSGVFDNLRTKLAETTITSLVQSIEFYKVQHGAYPDSLETLRKSLPENSPVFIFDPTAVHTGGQPRLYYYELIDADHYYLLGVGPDGRPFTSDDILPQVVVGPESKSGFVRKAPASGAQPPPTPQ